MESTIYVKPERIRQYVIDLFGHYHVSKTDAAMIADNLSLRRKQTAQG